MSFLDYVTGAAQDGAGEAYASAREAELESLREAYHEEQSQRVLLDETIAQLELTLEDTGWQRIEAGAEHEFSRDGKRRANKLARLFAIANPLVRRGVNLRIAYVWGGGVQISARATGPTDDNPGSQDVNAVVQDFMDDGGNLAALFSSEAREQTERGLATDGDRFVVCFTNPRTGRVKARVVETDQIDDVICNPDDVSEPWYYLRRWTTRTVGPDSAGVTTVTQSESREALYPAVGFYPPRRPRSIDGIPVVWDAPILHGAVNRPDGWKFGVADAYSVMTWARAYSVFLNDWARLVKALSRYAYTHKSDRRSKAERAATRIAETPGTSSATGAALDVGGTAVMGPGQSLEAVPKTGATIDSGSGRPLAAMVAAGLDVPVTMLLADPGVTGARATAETLDTPTENTASLRRAFHEGLLRRLFGYVVLQSVKAPAGALRGRVFRDDDGVEQVELAGDTDTTVEFVWPDLSEETLLERVTAIEKADGTGVLPDEIIARMLLEALGVRDVDEIIEANTDDEGNWVSPDTSAGDVAVRAFSRGEDPADAVR